MNASRRRFLQLAGVAGTGWLVSRPAFGQRSNLAGAKVTVAHAIARLADRTEVATPYWRIESGRSGPSFGLIAAQHGNEVIGSEVARRFGEVCARELQAGTVWLIPMANLLAARARRHSFDLGPEQNNRMHPTKRNNMQRTWPGNPEGNPTERIAHALDEAVIRHCTHLVDMHCWQHVTAAETLAVEDHAASLAMADVTTTRFVSRSRANVPAQGAMMVAQLLQQRKQASMVMELSGQFSMPERQVQMGLTSMVNLARHLGLLRGQPEHVPTPRVVRVKEKSHEVRALATGMFVPARRGDGDGALGPEDWVEKGQPLGHIIRETDLVTVPHVAPVAGYLWQFGLCHWTQCDASLPALHPYTEEKELLATVVTV